MTRSSLLLLTRDDVLAQSVQQLAAAAGVTVDQATSTTTSVSPGDAASPLARPSLVLADVAHLDSGAVRRRRGAPLHVLALGPVADSVYRRALDAGALGVVAVPEDLGRLSELLAELDRPRQGRVVAVTGGSGGVGTSVTATALALRASASPPATPTLLVDLDVWGPGLGRVLGGRLGDGITWHDLSDVDGRLSASELASALPRDDALALLTWPDDGAVPVDDRLVAEVVAAAARGHDWVVIDCPRGAARSPDLLGLCDLVLLLVAGTVAGVASAARVAAPLRAAGAPVGLVVRDGGVAVPGDEVSRLLGLPLVAEVRHDRRLREHVDAGLGPVRGRRSSLVRAADDVLALLESGQPVGEPW